MEKHTIDPMVSAEHLAGGALCDGIQRRQFTDRLYKI